MRVPYVGVKEYPPGRLRSGPIGPPAERQIR
jgi:hypothetical protein